MIKFTVPELLQAFESNPRMSGGAVDCPHCGQIAKMTRGGYWVKDIILCCRACGLGQVIGQDSALFDGWKNAWDKDHREPGSHRDNEQAGSDFIPSRD